MLLSPAGAHQATPGHYRITAFLLAIYNGLIDDMRYVQAWELAERTSDMIKTIFLGLYFSALVPSTLIITSIALFIR